MGEDCGNPVELTSHHGVLLEDRMKREFHQTLGTLSIVDYKSGAGKCIEWHPCDVLIESDDQGWAMVENAKNHKENSCDIASRNAKGPEVQIPLHSIKYFEANNRQKLIVSATDTEIAFHFQNGSSESFLESLKKNLPFPIDKDLQMIDRSVVELDLFTDDTTRHNFIWGFVKSFHDNPYETTMNTFAKVTNALFLRTPYSDPEFRSRSLIADEANMMSRISSEDYELIPQGVPLPPRTIPPRLSPLTVEQWLNFFDDLGRITEWENVKRIIFHGGISKDGNLRSEVWKFLLDYYPWNSTFQEREELRRQKVNEYYTMKSQWETMTVDQIERFSAYKERKNLIEKDVHRTDRTVDFYAGENNPNLVCLQDILMTYVMYNFNLGYVQGMSDLLSPLLATLNDEVDTFWCFVGFLNLMGSNFEFDQVGMKEQLENLYYVLRMVEPDLASYLDDHDSNHMSFCFRWLLIWFKREFNFEDIATLWEILWTGLPCKNYHLLLCVAILANEKDVLMSENYGLPDILMHINKLANKIDLETTLRRAEGIYIQISNAASLATAVKDILGLSVACEKDHNQRETRINGTSQVD